MDGEKKKYKPKAAFLKNSGKRVANLNSVPSPIRPARVATVPKTKTKKMEAMRRKIARTYRPSNNTPRVQGTVLPRPNLTNAVKKSLSEFFQIEKTTHDEDLNRKERLSQMHFQWPRSPRGLFDAIRRNICDARR
jgi:hypothetical protein